MTQQDTHCRLRFPLDLRDFLRESAKHNQRSINGEVVFALRQYQKAASGQN